MEKHQFQTLADFRGKSLDYFTTHADLVKRQAERKAAQKAAAEASRQAHKLAQRNAPVFDLRGEFTGCSASI